MYSFKKPTIESPLAYFGNRFTSSEEMVGLLQYAHQTCHTFYDLFAGMGALSLAAIEFNVAKNYVVNDINPDIKHFWETVQSDRKALIHQYQTLVEKYQQSENFVDYFNQLQQSYSVLTKTEKAATFAFILNHCQHGELSYEQNQLACKPTSDSKTAQAFDEAFEKRVIEVGALLDKHQDKIQFTAKPYASFNEQMSKDDVIILDPPYPCTHPPIYHRDESADALYQSLKKNLQQWSKREISYWLNFEVVGKGFFKPEFESLQTLHYVHIAPAQGDYGRYVEHVYVSQTLATEWIKLNARQPHPHVIQWQPHFDTLYDTDYQEVAKEIEKKCQSAYSTPELLANHGLWSTSPPKELNHGKSEEYSFKH